VIVKETEEPIEPDINARGLHHGLIPRVQLDALLVDFCPDIAVTQKHKTTLVESGTIAPVGASRV